MGVNPEVLKHIQEVDELLSKAQILRGDNSERRNWAGSSWEDTDVPSYAPNGTDYDPPKDVRRATNKKPFKKSVDEMSEAELERELLLRKSSAGMPNVEKARHEILKSIEGVEETICPSCDGSKIDHLSKSICGTCHGFGFCFTAPEGMEKSVSAKIDAIAEKYNVGAEIDALEKSLEKAQKKNKGGGVGEADTTGNPSHMESEKEDFTGDAVFKGDLDAMYGELEKTKKMMKKGDEAPEGGDINAQPPAGGNPAAPQAGAENLQMSKALTKEALLSIMDAQQLILKGMGQMLKKQSHLEKGLRVSLDGQADIADLVADSATLQGHFFKGLFGATEQQSQDINKSNNAQNRQPNQAARPPRASGRNIQILNKSFVDSAPGGDENPLQKYDHKTLIKGASQMCIDPTIPMDKRLNRRVVIGLEQGVVPEEKILKSIVAYIDQKGIEE